MSRETHLRDHSLPPEALLSLIPVGDAEELGVHAIAHVKLHAPDSLFAAYVTGFDGADTLWGLISAGEMDLGCLYISGLIVAWRVWGISIQHDPQFKPVTLQHLIEDKRVDVKPRPNITVSGCHASREDIRSRLCVHLVKEPHRLYGNRQFQVPIGMGHGLLRADTRWACKW